MRILLLEDDRHVSDYIVQGMKEAGHICDAFSDGAVALVQATHEPYDLLIVDRMVPGLDGLTVVKTLRSTGNRVPILLLTALSDVEHRVDGLNAGADDYLGKPFAFSELLARVNALARRPPIIEQDTTLKVHDLTMELLVHKVSRAGQTISLSPREFLLLEVLMRNSGKIITRTMLLERVWDFHFDPQTTVVETHISRLRSKVDKPFDVPLLHTIRGIGYTLHMD